MAAAYLLHVCRNQASGDGDRRTALAAAEVFLLLKGRQLRATSRRPEQLTVGVAEGKASKDEAVAFFGD
jgi:death-on-curing protein